MINYNWDIEILDPTNNNEDCCKISCFLGRVWSTPDCWLVVLAHPGVDQEVHVGEVGEGDHASGEQPSPVDVVEHVVWINPQTCHIVNQDLLRHIVLVLVLHHLMLGLEELGDVEDDGEDHGGEDVGHHPALRGVGEFQGTVEKRSVKCLFKQACDKWM